MRVSKLLRFIRFNQGVTTSAPVITGLPAHPRVWMNPSRLTKLQAAFAANTTRWQKVKAVADAQVAKGAVTSQSDVHHLGCLGLAYLATNSSLYSDRAGVVITGQVNSSLSTYAQGDSAYYYRWALPDVALGLDWCYAGLTTAQKQQAATWLMDAADWVWPDSNPSRSGAWAVNSPDSNYYWGFMMSGMAAIAASGDDTGTGTISGADRATYHKNLAASKWSGPVLTAFNSQLAGGAWTEGSNYDSSWYVARFVDAYVACGQTLAATTFMDDAIRWHLHATAPDFSHRAPIGDQPRISASVLFTYDRNAVMHLAMLSSNSTLISQVYYWLNRIGQIPTDDNLNTNSLVEEMIGWDSSIVPSTDLSALPLYYLAPGPSFLVWRSSWTDANATFWQFECGPQKDHISRNCNGLRIWKGTYWISADSNIYSASGIVQATRFFNNVTIGATQGQNLYGANFGVLAATPQLGASFIVIRGQAKSAYGYPAGTSTGRTVTDAVRTVVYIPSLDSFIVMDHDTFVDPSQSKVIRWQMLNMATIVGSDSFVLSNPANTFHAYGKVHLPATLTSIFTEAENPDGGATTSNAVAITLIAGNATDLAVETLQLSSAASAPFTPTASSDGTNVTVLIGGKTVTIPINPILSVTVV